MLIYFEGRNPEKQRLSSDLTLTAHPKWGFLEVSGWSRRPARAEVFGPRIPWWRSGDLPRPTMHRSLQAGGSPHQVRGCETGCRV